MLLALALAAGEARAQSSSLFAASQTRAPMTLQDCSWTFTNPEEPKTVKLQHLVTVLVKQSATMLSDEIDRQKQGLQDWALPNWIKFYGGKLGADGRLYGEPHIQGTVNNKLQAEGKLQTKDSLQFSITCHVVDIRPKSTWRSKATTRSRSTRKAGKCSLSGEIRPEAIKPNNTVQSEEVAELRIDRRQTGSVRDSYRRGWALQWLDHWQPF